MKIRRVECVRCKVMFNAKSNLGPLPKYCDPCKAQNNRDMAQANRKHGVLSVVPGGAEPAEMVPFLALGELGPIERALQEDLSGLISAHPMRDGLEQVALSLARGLDRPHIEPIAGRVRELRAVLADLVKHHEGGAAPVDPSEALSAPVRDASDPW